MDCETIKAKLSSYIDGVVEADEERAIREHLESCAKCSAALAELRKTVGYLRNLEGPEPPPWLSQKVMAKVMEEKRKKGRLLTMLFYPLHIKIPIQALATILIAVVSVYIFKMMQHEIQPAKLPFSERDETVLLGKENHFETKPEEGEKTDEQARYAGEPDADRHISQEEVLQGERAKKHEYAPAPPAPADEFRRLRNGQGALESKEQLSPQERQTGKEYSSSRKAARSELGQEEPPAVSDALRDRRDERKYSAPAAGAPVGKTDTVIFIDDTIRPDDIARVLTVTLVQETGHSVVFEVEYFLAEYEFGGRPRIGVYPDIPDLAVSDVPAVPGRHKVTIPVGIREAAGTGELESGSFRVAVSVYRDNRKADELFSLGIPFRKIWKKEEN